jgi:nitrite reductase/ring-hydroxylating ferredoxin subunit
MASVERVASMDDLAPGACKRVTVQGSDVLLVNIAGEYSAVSADCPHAGGPLDEGPLEGEVIECQWHGSRFSCLTGAIVNGPALDPLNKYAVIIRGNDVLVDISLASA